MNVFISWSGDTSHRVAKVLRDWIPSVIQAVEPYVSSEDIDKGTRWSSDIATELDKSSYGIICLTKQNIHAPWINFEAGALGKSVDKSKVSPFLFRMNPSDVNGPLLQYQSTRHDKDDIYKLMLSINSSCGEQALDNERLNKIFEVWWPNLEKNLDEIPAEVVEQASTKQNSSPKSADLEKFSKIFEELLDLSRTNHQLLRNPESLLPKDYLDFVLNNKPKDGERELPHVIRDAFDRFRILEELILELSTDENLTEIRQALIDLKRPINYLTNNYLDTGKIRSRRITRAV
ncbi:TIR domain-containing protein [Citrobacter sp. wls615]|uniref:TIR domain-containing protein n=1 Tax=unclassified Citrobacter TaxID=2644389 RepID=UPI0010C98BB7|nr:MULTISPECIES: TIR domain-containing protein [unclassified Citrobacter]MBJ8886916.1 toll/interleukin-1 receptor domain-containing protein [Citrobacter sp. FDAARGOS_156]TKV15701.1 TIR domain-containing protein [Citrobacter sp. wls615]HED2480935.1 toll/interleukin-1 receptor domain-containing protein [Citrobacter youngae]